MALQKERNHKMIDTLAAAAFLGTVTFGVHNMKVLQGTANSNSELAASDQNSHKQHIVSAPNNNNNHKKASNNKKTDKNKNKDLSNLLASAASDVSKGSGKSAAIAKAADQAVNGNSDLLKQVASNTAKNKNNNPNLDKLENHIIKDKLPNTPTQHDDKINSDIANSLVPKAPSSKAINSGANINDHVTPSSAVPNTDHKITPPTSSASVAPTPTPTPSHSTSVAPTPTPSSSASTSSTPAPSSSAQPSESNQPVTPSHSTATSGSGSQAPSQSGSGSSATPTHPDGSITSVPHNGTYSVTINFVDSTGNTIAKSLPVSVQMNTDQKINEALTNQVQSQLKSLSLENGYNIAANGLPNYIVAEKDGSLTYTVPLTDKNVPNTTGDGSVQGGSEANTSNNQNSSTNNPTINIQDVSQQHNNSSSDTPVPVTPQAQEENAINELHSISTAGIDLQ